jgi:hypothetical protein
MSTDSLDVEKWIRFAQMDFDSAVALAERFRPPIEVLSLPAIRRENFKGIYYCQYKYIDKNSHP